ncbi:MAG TPA: site-2 protease family protein [Jatrophihabitans sp.]
MTNPNRPAANPRPAEDRPALGGRLIRLGSAFGVPIFVTPSWLLVAVFVTVSYSGFLRDQVRGLSVGGAYLLGAVYAVALAASVLAHELGHTVVSRAVGLPVRRIVVFLLGGVSEIDGQAERPRDEFAIAAAGPAVSVALAAGCWAASLIPPNATSVQVLLNLLAWSNLVVAVFNVLPGLPLDGGRLVQALIWMLGKSRQDGVIAAAWCGRGVAVLVALAVFAGNAAISRNRPTDLSMIGATAMGFAVAAFLWFGASQALRVAGIGRRAAGLELGHLIRPAVYLPSATPISEAVRRVAESRAAGIVVVDADGRSRGIVQEAAIAGLDNARRPWATVADVSASLVPGMVLSDTLNGTDLLAAVQAHPATEYLVIGADGISRGVIAAADLARALGLRYA